MHCWRGRKLTISVAWISTNKFFDVCTQGFLGLPMDIVERAVADCEGDLEMAVNALLERPEQQKAPTPKQAQSHFSSSHHQTPPQQNGHSPWQDTPTPPGKLSPVMVNCQVTGHAHLDEEPSSCTARRKRVKCS